MLHFSVIEREKLRIEDLGNNSEQDSSQRDTVVSDVRTNPAPATEDGYQDDDIIEVDSIPASYSLDTYWN